MKGHTVARGAVAALVALGSLGLAACDEEDVNNVEEGVRDTQEQIEEGANDAEKAVDDAGSDGEGN